jgi:hypothetical protein
VCSSDLKRYFGLADPVAECWTRDDLMPIVRIAARKGALVLMTRFYG